MNLLQHIIYTTQFVVPAFNKTPIHYEGTD